MIEHNAQQAGWAADDREQIRDVKARYFRLLDTKQWDAWGEVFAVDAVMDMPEAKLYVEGRDAIVKAVHDILDKVITVHHGHNPEIEIIDADNAKAIWAMEDYLIWPPQPDEKVFAHTTRGYGHYYETYTRADGTWRIARTHLSRLHVETLQQYRSITTG